MTNKIMSKDEKKRLNKATNLIFKNIDLLLESEYYSTEEKLVMEKVKFELSNVVAYYE